MNAVGLLVVWLSPILPAAAVGDAARLFLSPFAGTAASTADAAASVTIQPLAETELPDGPGGARLGAPDWYEVNSLDSQLMDVGLILCLHGRPFGRDVVSIPGRPRSDLPRSPFHSLPMRC
jgi:hypothetical protein